MTLVIENADSKILAVLESLKAFNPELNIQEECEICRVHGYIPNKKTRKVLKKHMKKNEKSNKRLLKAIEEVKNGEVEIFDSFESFKADLMK